jgi:hypothetical protein
LDQYIIKNKDDGRNRVTTENMSAGRSEIECEMPSKERNILLSKE